MRIAIIGRQGQIAQALVERASLIDAETTALARPEIDLLRPEGILAKLADARVDIVVNAAAYTSVDLAESEPDVAQAINVKGAAAVAKAAWTLNLPVIHLSTDYVFDGTLTRPYREDDCTCPINRYGQTKLEGEQAVAFANPNHAILRTGWIYSPFGKNFLKTMLSLAIAQGEVAVVADQVGSPASGLDVADAILRIADNLMRNPANPRMRGIFHMPATGEATWAQFAAAIFEAPKAGGGPSAQVRPISTSEYPTAARRPANSRLDSARLATVHGVVLPHWQTALPITINRLVPTEFSASSMCRR